MGWGGRPPPSSVNDDCFWGVLCGLRSGGMCLQNIAGSSPLASSATRFVVVLLCDVVVVASSVCGPVKVHACRLRSVARGCGLEAPDESLHGYGWPAVTTPAGVVLLIGGIVIEFFLTSNLGSGYLGETFDPIGSGDIRRLTSLTSFGVSPRRHRSHLHFMWAGRTQHRDWQVSNRRCGSSVWRFMWQQWR
jgi:hypothetical protein